MNKLLKSVWEEYKFFIGLVLGGLIYQTLTVVYLLVVSRYCR
jgi:hypothetical protein